jgi:uncharacterized protein
MNNSYNDIYISVKAHVIAKLKADLPAKFTYHSLEHTLDVLEQVQRIIKAENIHDEENLFLVQMAALYHDTGFLFVYTGHEAKSCELANKELPAFGVTQEQLEKIGGMIMATKIPQSPLNILEEAICDADLDYLGRDDFEEISDNLYKEFTEFGIVKDYDQWMKMQVGFFESHHYFTKSSRATREPMKQEQLKKIKMYQPSANR